MNFVTGKPILLIATFSFIGLMVISEIISKTSLAGIEKVIHSIL
jgi:hypothetical protein